MSLVWAALSPHPPILIPNIGKENLNKLEKTQQAFAELKDSLYLSQADTLLVITSHGVKIDNSFVINQGTLKDNENIYLANFEEFGDFETKYEWIPDVYLSYKVRTFLEGNIPIKTINDENLSHGVSVPLSLLLNKNTEKQVLVLHTSNLNKENHIKVGEYLKEIIMTQDKKIAVLASGDLSHRLDDSSPLEPTSAGPEFDQFIREKLQEKDYQALIDMDEKLIENAGECTYKPLLIILSLLKNYNWEFKELSYEKPFGVGYLNGEFKINSL